MFVLCAMPEEAAGLVKALREHVGAFASPFTCVDATCCPPLSVPVTRLRLPDYSADVSVCTVGVGKVAMAAAVSELATLARTKYHDMRDEFVVNVGVAGWMPFQHEDASPINTSAEKIIGRCFYVSHAIEGDLDASPLLPKFSNNKDIVGREAMYRPSDLLCRLLSIYREAPHGLVAVTQDKLVKDRYDVAIGVYDLLLSHGVDRRSGISASVLVDMESAVFYKLADEHAMPRLALKVVSDIVGETPVTSITERLDEQMRKFAVPLAELALAESVVTKLIRSGALGTTSNSGALSALECALNAAIFHGIAGDTPAFIHKP